MLNEFIVDLCFIRPQTEQSPPFPTIESELDLLFSTSAASAVPCYVDRKREEGLDIAVAQISGLSTWSSEQDVITYMEAGMERNSLEWLSGYRIQVVPKENAGSCCMKKGG
ncbi:hypothetical protein PAECIP111893_02107 [Paenibacillus plantiphilus]|uniref:Uncharacterized protein n=1 Tax=Paenibacillus plantiphilus TaxID=2905650 RepID=A0ABM9C5U5_9BACL|nr:hypothetical protein [Paenibacillus plantiphilus]CAH1203889.1 hypothetical protein PAECIP111893_02107 [Paenibacillus plantiphilus]